VIINPGNFDYYENGNTRFKGIDSYIMFQSPNTNTTLANNYLQRDASSAGFVSQNMDIPANFVLLPNSPLIDAVDYNAKTATTFDFYNHVRPFGPKSDVGAMESDIATSATQIPLDTLTNQSWLLQNPISELLTICFHRVPEQVSNLEIINLHGVIVTKVEQSKIQFGQGKIEVNLAGLPAGVYLYLLRSIKSRYSGKFIKL